MTTKSTPNTQGASWEGRTQAFLEQFIATCKEKPCEGCLIDVQAVMNHIREVSSKERAAFGGCLSCYGKGYSTVKSFLGGRHFLVANDPYEPCPKCDRGKQIAELIAKERAEGERRGREKALEPIHAVLVGFDTQNRPAWELFDLITATLPADSTEEKCTKTYCDCAEHWGKPNKCVDMDCVCDTHDSTEETNNHD